MAANTSGHDDGTIYTMISETFNFVENSDKLWCKYECIIHAYVQIHHMKNTLKNMVLSTCPNARWNVVLNNTLGRRVLRVDDEEVIWKTAYS